MEESEAAQQRLKEAGGTILMTDWRDSVFFNLAVDPVALQPIVPFPLDLYEGSAYVSIVAFDQIRFRTPLLGGLPSPLVRPLGSHLFCNMRTYVRYNGEPGIFFMREWVPNPIGPLFAPYTYGLPYKFSRVHYEHDRARGEFLGRVVADGEELVLRARIDYDAPLHTPAVNSLDAFVMERYTGFQTPLGRRVRFRIWHVPWPEHRADGEIAENALLRTTGSWAHTARLASVNYSPGIDGVHIGLVRLL